MPKLENTFVETGGLKNRETLEDVLSRITPETFPLDHSLMEKACEHAVKELNNELNQIQLPISLCTPEALRRALFFRNQYTEKHD